DGKFKEFGRGFRGSERDGVAGASGAVGVARIDEDGAQLSFGEGEVLAAEAHGRGGDTGLGEDAGGVGGEAAVDEREIVLLNGAKARVHGGVSVSEGEVRIHMAADERR